MRKKVEERTSIPEILAKDCILKCLMGKGIKILCC